MSEGIAEDGIKHRLLWCDYDPPEALRGPQPLPPRDLEALEHRQREERQKLCVCGCVWEKGGHGGELISQKPPAPSRRKLAAEWAEKGMGRGGRWGAWVWFSVDCSLPHPAETSWCIYAPSSQGHAATCRGTPGRFQARAEVSRRERLASLQATGWSRGSRGEKWAGWGATCQHPGVACGLEGQRDFTWHRRDYLIGLE